ncbi:MAG: YqaA family protein [Oceanococcaceae bacterium]
MGAYLLLFATAFGAATLLPFYSEVLLVAQLRQGLDPWGLWLAATSGNTLGAVVNWVLGLYLIHFVGRRWFPVSQAQVDRAQRWYQRWGIWSLLLAWLPVGGDPLTFVAGMMRVRLSLFLLLVGFGKGARYALIVWATPVPV